MYMAKTSKAQLLAQAKFKQEKRDTLTIDLPKGTKDGYKTSAAAFGMSLTFLIQCGVEEFIQNHGGEVNFPAQTAPITTQPAEQISATQRRLLDAVNQLPTDAQKSLLKFLQSLNAQQVNVAATNKTAENTAENASVDAQEPI